MRLLGPDKERDGPAILSTLERERMLSSVKDSLEKRRTVRYKLCLPLVVEWTDEGGTVTQEAGFTRDISTCGLYVTCATFPPINSIVRLQIAFPPNKEIRPDGLKFSATAQVVRLATDTETAGFAAVGELAKQDGNRKRGIHLVDNVARR